MAMIDVCLYDYNICDLGDMSILGEIPKEDEIDIYKHLDSIKEIYNLKLVIMDFNQPLRNGLYSIFPGIIIIIHPRYVIGMINNYLNPIEGINDRQGEIAAAVDNHQLTIHELGCQDMYTSTSKEGAMNYYRQWQGDVPLGIDSFHNIITKIDYYYEEVFNYFDFKNIFA